MLYFKNTIFVAHKIFIEMRIAVVGATGLVGQEIIRVMEERAIEFTELYLVASPKSVG